MRTPHAPGTRTSSGGDSPLLPLDPPARAARWTAWLLLALGLASGLFATLVRLPETVVAPFVLVPAEGVDPLRAPLAGELASVEVQPGQAVRAGDALFRIRSDELRDGQARLRQMLGDRSELAERVRRLDESFATELEIQDAEIAQADRELEFRRRHLATSRDLLARAETLATEGLLSQVELLEHQLSAAESEKDLVQTEKVRQQLILRRQDRVTARARARIEERAAGERLEVGMEALRGRLADSSGDTRTVRAPHDAVVLTIPRRTPGSVVGAGEELCQLARPGSPSRVRLALPEAGVPRLQPGQPVRLFLTAFPYQRHGTVPARLGWISPAPTTDGNRTGFTAMADLAGSGPAALPLQVGMQGEARILVGRRSLLDRVLAPLRALRERSFPE